MASNVTLTPPDLATLARATNREIERLQRALKAANDRITELSGSSSSVSFGAPVSVGRANAEGSSDDSARRDHVHDVVMVHAEAFGFIVAGSGAWYVPFASHAAENGTPSAIHVWEVPFTGTITRVVIHTTANATDVTATLRDEALNQLEQTAGTVSSFSVGAATAYEESFAFDTDVTAGDKILLGLSFVANPSNVLGWIYLEVR